MKSTSSLLGWGILISLLLLSITFVDILALADIYQDYISTNVLELLQLDISDELPDWTSTSLEWAWIRIGLVVRTFLIIVIIVSLIRISKKLKP